MDTDGILYVTLILTIITVFLLIMLLVKRGGKTEHLEEPQHEIETEEPEPEPEPEEQPEPDPKPEPKVVEVKREDVHPELNKKRSTAEAENVNRTIENIESRGLNMKNTAMSEKDYSELKPTITLERPPIMDTQGKNIGGKVKITNEMISEAVGRNIIEPED